jgi:hypothetical protein
MYPFADSVAPAGISRRNFFRFAAGASALASFPILSESDLAQAQLPKFADPNKGIHIDARSRPKGGRGTKVCLRNGFKDRPSGGPDW